MGAEKAELDLGNTGFHWRVFQFVCLFAVVVGSRYSFRKSNPGIAR